MKLDYVGRNKYSGLWVAVGHMKRKGRCSLRMNGEGETKQEALEALRAKFVKKFGPTLKEV